jgi:hypothetical protein
MRVLPPGDNPVDLLRVSKPNEDLDADGDRRLAIDSPLTEPLGARSISP